MSENPYESPRESPLPGKETPKDYSLEAELRRKMIRLAIYMAAMVVVGIALLLRWALSPVIMRLWN